MIDYDKLRQRYQNDVLFNQFVNTFRQALASKRIRREDLIDALHLAELIVYDEEVRKPRNKASEHDPNL